MTLKNRNYINKILKKAQLKRGLLHTEQQLYTPTTTTATTTITTELQQLKYTATTATTTTIRNRQQLLERLARAIHVYGKYQLYVSGHYT